jgi:hypothetical protein
MLLRKLFYILSKKFAFFVLQSKYFKEENVKEREREACNHLNEGKEEEVS